LYRVYLAMNGVRTHNTFHRLYLFVIDSGTTCRDDTVTPVCNSFDTNGYITMIGSTYRDGCAWSYNTGNPSHDVTSAMKSHCDNYNICPVVVNDNRMGQSCSASSYWTDSFSYSSSYWCRQYGWYSCDTTLSASNRYQKIEYCGKLYWDYSCTGNVGLQVIQLCKKWKMKPLNCTGSAPVLGVHVLLYW
jgi:hypothetical protein